MNNDLISRQAAIDALESIGSLDTNADREYARSVFETLPSVQPEPHWIPCGERLPDEGRYLVTRHDYVTKTNFIDILWFEKNVWWNRQFTGNFAVFAWMPLPELYRAKRRTDGSD